MTSDDPMDAYSQVVMRVAEDLLPSVASVRVVTARGRGAGSAGVITADGFLLTSAHVVAAEEPDDARFADRELAAHERPRRYRSRQCGGRIR